MELRTETATMVEARDSNRREWGTETITRAILVCGNVDAGPSNSANEVTRIGRYPLVEMLNRFAGRRVVAHIMVANNPINAADLLAKMLGDDVVRATGEVNARAWDSYSETTGFLWSNEEARIGEKRIDKVIFAADYACLFLTDGTVQLDDMMTDD